MTLEAAIVHPVMLTMVFMIIIGGMGVVRHQQVACQAREAARWAAVRGSDWRRETGKTCPTKADILQKTVLPLSAGMDPKKLDVQVDWIDRVTGQTVDWDKASKHPKSVTSANRGVSNHVRVTVTYQWSPELFVVGSITLKSTSEIAMAY